MKVGNNMNKEYSKLLKENNCSRLKLLKDSIQLFIELQLHEGLQVGLNGNDEISILNTEIASGLAKFSRARTQKEYIISFNTLCILINIYMVPEIKKAKAKEVEEKENEIQEVKNKWKGII